MAKACKGCDKEKSLDEFGVDNSQADGRTKACLVCRRTRGKAATQRWRKRNPDHARRHYASNPEVRVKNRDRWYRRYGLTVERYEGILLAQGGVCATCDAEPGSARANGKRLAVDHDHSCCPGRSSCGQCVRGLICDSCNVALGRVQDDARILLRMAAYLAPNAIRTNSADELITARKVTT